MKFGFDQLGKVAPQWIRIIADYSIIVLGGLSVWSLAIPEHYMSSDSKNFFGATATLIVSIINGFKMLSGKQEQPEIKP